MTRVLVIDDDEAIRQIVSLLLKKRKFDVEVASGGAAALRMFKAQPSELVITDLVMPEVEGIELIQQLHAMSPEVKIIAMSGYGWYGEVDMLQMARLLGASATLAKPFNKSAFYNTIDRVLEGTAANGERPE